MYIMLYIYIHTLTKTIKENIMLNHIYQKHTLNLKKEHWAYKHKCGHTQILNLQHPH